MSISVSRMSTLARILNVMESMHFLNIFSFLQTFNLRVFYMPLRSRKAMEMDYIILSNMQQLFTST